MAIPSGQHIRKDSATDHFDSFAVGDTIKITGSEQNNGIYTVSSITADGGHSYMGIVGSSLTDDTNDSSVVVTKISSKGNKIVCLGDEDTGEVDIWSYNSASNVSGTIVKFPSVGTKGWATKAITPVLNGSNAKFIFTQTDDTLRVCDTNESNASVIKWFGHLNHKSFGSSGGIYGGYEEHPNILRKPHRGGYVTYNYDDERAYGIETDADSATVLTNNYDIRQWLGVQLTGSDQMGGVTDDTLRMADADGATNIPLGIVIGLGTDNKNEVDTNSNIGAERFLVRDIDLTGSNNYDINVYRGYAGTTATDIDSSSKYVYQYGCGFNFKVSENGTSDSGTYMANVYEFAQSFIYDNEQESLLRTDTNIGAANTLTTSNDSRALDIIVYAHGPYPGRIRGGRIYQRISGTNQPWSLLVDINFERGCRTALDSQFETWSDASGDSDIPSGCFYSDVKKSIHPQIDTYSSLNGFEPDIDFISIGGIGERYQTSVIAGRRMFVANLQLKNTTGGINRFGDRIMYSEPNKFDTFPKYNFIDVSKGDAEDYIKLEFFSDRLLAFKQHTLHVINIQNSSPSGWYLEKSIKHVGINYPYSVTRTPIGVAWANQTGCHFFDGKNISDLTQNKIKETGSTVGDSPSWDSFVTGSDYLVKPVVMYSPKNKQLLIIRNPDNSSTTSNECYIYNFKTQSWVYDTSLFVDNQQISNPIIDWNNNLVYAYNVDDDDDSVQFKQINDTSSSSVTQSFITKDIDFGQPAYVKKIYKIYITYKNSGTNTLTDDMYAAVDGSTSFANSAISSPHSSYEVALTGTFASSQSNWNIATFSFSRPLLCQSLALKFLSGAASGISINDISFEYRIIKKRVS